MNKLIRKGIFISIFPSMLITFMLDYGTEEKTFITESFGKEIVYSGLDGIGMFIEKNGLLKYIFSIYPTFLVIFCLCILLVIIETKYKEKRQRHAAK